MDTRYSCTHQSEASNNTSNPTQPKGALVTSADKQEHNYDVGSSNPLLIWFFSSGEITASTEKSFDHTKHLALETYAVFTVLLV